MKTRMDHQIFTHLFFIFSLCLLTIPLGAITRTSDGGAWNNPYNWTPFGVPENGDEVIISGDVDITNFVNLNDVIITIEHTGRLIFGAELCGLFCVNFGNLVLTGNSGIIIEDFGQIKTEMLVGFFSNIIINGETVWSGDQGTLTGPGSLPVGFLPVELVSFSGTPMDGGRVSLQWLTASELNNEGFELQRSHDALDWEYITFIDGQGTSLVPFEYEYTDHLPPGTQSMYYRLKQMDFDGNFEFSPVINVRLEDNMLAGISLYPNPARETINITGQSGEAVIYSSIGQVIQRFQLQNGTTNRNINELPAGTYAIKVVQHNGEQFTSQFLKQ